MIRTSGDAAGGLGEPHRQPVHSAELRHRRLIVSQADGAHQGAAEGGAGQLLQLLRQASLERLLNVRIELRVCT